MDIARSLYAYWIAIAAGGIVLFVAVAAIRAATGKPVYRRGRVYRVWPGRREFRIQSVESFDDVQRLLKYLIGTYDIEIVESDPEPDDSVWILAGEPGRIELHYDDHERARIRSVKNGGRLFDRILRDIRPRRSIFF